MKDYSNVTLLPKKGLLGYSLVPRSDTNKTARSVRNQLGKVDIEYIEKKVKGEKEVFFRLKNQEKTTSEYSYIKFYAKDKALVSIFGINENRYVNVDFSTGEISDEFHTALYPVFYDKDNRLFTIGEDGKFLYNGYRYTGKRVDGDYSYQYFPVVDENGRVGIMDKNCQLYCDCRFDSAENLSVNYITIGDEFITQIHEPVSKKFILRYSKQEFEIDVEKPEVIKFKNGYFTIVDQVNNKSYLFRMDEESKTIEDHGSYDGKISKMIVEKKKGKEEIYFLSDDASSLYAPYGKTLLKNCINIEQAYLEGEKCFVYKQKVDNKSYAGVYSTADKKVILSPNQRCTEVDISNSARGEDKTIKFLAAKSVMSEGEDKTFWGIIDSNGATIRNFEFTKDKESKSYSYRQSSELGYEVEDFKLIDKDNNPRYFNLKEQDIESTGKARYSKPKTSSFRFDNSNCHLKSSSAYKQSEKIASGFANFYSFSSMFGSLFNSL